MEDKSVESIVNDYLYSELEWVKKRIHELSDLNFMSLPNRQREMLISYIIDGKADCRFTQKCGTRQKRL